MDELMMCGICLNMDVKMYKLQGFPLEDYYTWIVGNLLETNISHYFQFACYECAYQIEKYNSFREKCLRSQSLLIEMFQKKGKLTKDDVKSIERQKFDLCSNLTYGLQNMYTVGCVDIKQDFYIKVENNALKGDDIKIELSLEENEENETITPQSNDDEHSFTLSTEKKKTSKRLISKVASDENVNRSLKKRRQKKDSEEKCMEKAGRKLRPPNRKQDLMQNSRVPTTLDNSLVNHLKIITYTIEEQLKQLMKRKELPNYINSKYKCNICYKGFIDPDAFNYHLKRHDPANGSKICPICKICFVRKTAFCAHRLQHAKNYQCKTCSRVCLTLTQAKTHLEEHKGKTYSCEQCGHVTTKRSSLLTHIRLKHPSDFVCDVCGFSFVNEVGLRIHKMRHRFDAESERSSRTKKGYCESCNVHCNSHQAWKKHINSLSHKIKTDSLVSVYS